jgi:hypothetical protein
MALCGCKAESVVPEAAAGRLSGKARQGPGCLAARSTVTVFMRLCVYVFMRGALFSVTS